MKRRSFPGLLCCQDDPQSNVVAHFTDPTGAGEDGVQLHVCLVQRVGHGLGSLHEEPVRDVARFTAHGAEGDTRENEEVVDLTWPGRNAGRPKAKPQAGPFYSIRHALCEPGARILPCTFTGSNLVPEP